MRTAALLLSTCLAVAAALLTSPARGQNLVSNGDFGNGSVGWTISGYAVDPKVMPFDTSGTGVSTSFSCRPGSKKGTLPPGGTLFIQQNVQMTQGLLHLLTADVAIFNSLGLTNVHAGTFEFYVDQVLIGRAKYKGIQPNETLRRQVCIRFTPQASGSKVLKIGFQRDWGAQLLTPRSHIDNITITRLPLSPLICPRLERKIGGNLTLDIYGQPSAGYALFVSGTTIPPLRPPGFAGTWSIGLPPQSLMVLVGALDSTGAHQQILPLPASLIGLAGVPLHWQGIEVSSQLTLGHRADFGIYK